jgi:hypothetical protein
VRRPVRSAGGLGRRRLRFPVPWLVAGLGATLLSPVLPAFTAAEGPAPQRFVLRLETELVDVLPLDVNDDGLLDLIVLEADRGKRDASVRARVFLQTRSGFDGAAGSGDVLPAQAVLAGAGLFVQGPGLALLLPDALALWIWRDGHFVPEGTVPVVGAFPFAGGGMQTGLSWVADVNGDGLSDVLVPRPDGALLLRQDGQGRWRPGLHLRTRAHGEILPLFRRKVVGYELPSLALLDAAPEGPRAGWRDLLAFSDGVLSLFHLEGTESGERAPVFELDLQPPLPFEPTTPFDPPLQLIAAQDLNGDGWTDLVFVKNRTGDSEFTARTRTLVHYGHAPAAPGDALWAAQPEQSFESEGFSLPFVVDLDRDGRVDLVLAHVDVDFWTGIRALIARSVKAEAAYYLMSTVGRLPKQPSGSGSFTVKFSLGRAGPQPIALYGDFNGDGLPDLLLSADRDRLGIHWGQAGKFWTGSPDEVIQDQLPVRPERVRVLDLDGDGRDDLLLLYNRDDIRAHPEVQRTVTVLLSRYGTGRSPAKATPGRPAPRVAPPEAPPGGKRIAALGVQR